MEIKISDDEASEIVRKQWGEVAFRAMSALHKAGVKYEQEFPQSGDGFQSK